MKLAVNGVVGAAVRARICVQLMAKRAKHNVHENYAKLNNLGKKSFVTQSGIATLVRPIKEEGAPEVFSRSSIYRARKKSGQY